MLSGRLVADACVRALLRAIADVSADDKGDTPRR